MQQRISDTHTEWAIVKRMVHYVSLRKLVNAAAIYSSYYLSLWLRRPLMWGKPISLSVEPTTSCNLRCPECPSGLRSFTRPTGMLEMPVFAKLMQETQGHLLYLNLYFQGEPYLHPGFLELIARAHHHKVYTSTSTNAHYLTPEVAEQTVMSKLDRLIISIDGITQEVYEQYRIGGKLDKVLEGTRNVVEARKRHSESTLRIIFQFLVVKPNEHQIPQVLELARAIGVDEVLFKTAQVYNYENGNPLIPENAQYSRYVKQANGKWKLKGTLLNQCWRMWHSAVLTWDGKVVPCCFDKDAQHEMGKFPESSLNAIWKSKTYKTFRSQLLKGRQEIDICRNCSEGTKVWA
jgi:radical SAM protein with 4Fe4S-binding SPASM domain